MKLGTTRKAVQKPEGRIIYTRDRTEGIVIDVRPVYTIAIQDLLYDRSYKGWRLSDNGVRRVLRHTLGKKKARTLCRAAMRGAK